MNSVTYHTYVRMLGSSPGLLSSALQSLISCVQQLPKLDHNLKSKACDMGSQFFGSSVCILESTLSGLLQSISTSPPATFRSEDALSLVLAIQDAFHIFTPAGLLRCPPLSGSASGGSKVLPGCCATCPLIGGIDDLNNFGNGVFGEVFNNQCILIFFFSSLTFITCRSRMFRALSTKYFKITTRIHRYTALRFVFSMLALWTSYHPGSVLCRCWRSRGTSSMYRRK